MEDATPAENGIVVAVDWTPASDAAVRWGAAEAAMRGLSLILAHVIPPIVVDSHDQRLRTRIHRWQIHRGNLLLIETMDALTETNSLAANRISTTARFGNPVHALAELSAGAAMMVVGSRFRGSVGGRRLGSVGAGLCYRAHCPVAVVHRYDADLVGRPVVVGIDGSPASERAIAIAFDEASRRRVGLVGVHVWSDVGVFPLLGMDWHLYRDQAEEVLGERLAGWQEHYPDVTVQRRVYCDRPAHWLIDEASRAGLVVVGSHGRSAFGSLVLGSVATSVAEAVDVPVIVVRDQ